MPIQLFESEIHASTYAQARPSPPQSLIDAILNFLEEKCQPDESGRWSKAVDVGAGSGQTTFLMKDHFNQILGVDISAAQIGEANKRNIYPNISFKVSPAEKIPVENESVSLVTASQCLHWFDRESFYQEITRILAPGGVFATFGYLAGPVISPDNSTKENKFASLIKTCFNEFIDTDLWVQPATNFLNAKYPGLELPFDENRKIDTIIAPITYSVPKYLNYITSWSSYHELLKRNPEKAKSFIDNVVNQLKTILGTEDIYSHQIDLDFEFFLLMSRKPVN